MRRTGRPAAPFPRAPGMRAVWEGASPSANLMEVKASSLSDLTHRHF